MPNPPALGLVVLVTGGSGYLGQFLIPGLVARGHTLVYTYHSHKPSEAEQAILGGAAAVRANLQTGEGLEDCLKLGPPDVIINCAALSAPRDCEERPEAARELNVPRALLDWLHSKALGGEGKTQPLLIHLSTDQVYDGTKAHNKESDPTLPVNVYGCTKLEAEEEIARRWGNYAILRSSIIVGPPQPAMALPKTPPLTWMDKTLSSGKSATFFADEFRCPIYVRDFINICDKLIDMARQGPLRLLLNAGGPDRLSRADMADIVAQVRGYAAATSADVQSGSHALSSVQLAGTRGEGAAGLPPLSTLIERVPAASATNRGVKSPLDISMDTSRIVDTLGFALTPFHKAVHESFSS